MSADVSNLIVKIKLDLSNFIQKLNEAERFMANILMVIV